jgi:glycosyltransferase involved in cell wall biosynthesis
MMTIHKPTITVLMAVYNGEKGLKNTIESILNQTYKDFEFLIIDDCSTDRTVEIIKAYKDNRIRIYSNESNLGQTKSLNVGLRLAEGKYIARMDADDYSMLERLERQYKFITEHQEYSVVGTDCLIVDKSNTKRSVSKGCVKNEDIIMKLITGSPINHVSVLMKKEDIIDVGGYNPEYKISADFDLWSRLIRKGYKITTLNEILCAYRISDDSYSCRNETQKMEENADIIYKNIKYLSNYNVTKESAKQIVRRFSDEFIIMSEQDILKSEAIYKDITMQLKPEMGVKVERKKSIKYLSIHYLIAAYHYILDNKNEKARGVIKMFIRNYGINLYSIAVYLLTYTNAETVKKMNYLRGRYLGWI